MDLDAAEEAALEFSDSLLSADGKSSYWLDRREQFFKNSSFTLASAVSAERLLTILLLSVLDSGN